MASKQKWDAATYESQCSFVWEFGSGLVDLLDPQPGERILDLGCGPGQLTQQIADRGADVVGVDVSPEMIGQARRNFPRLRFVLQDAAAMQFDTEFDAVFSNAALHWMLDFSGVARAISRALRRGGRFVAELGGKGNLAQIRHALGTTARHYCGTAIPESRTKYPSIGEYAAVLEAHSLEVRTAQLFDRPTILHGEQGMLDWILQFKSYYFAELPAAQRQQALTDTVDALRPLLFRDGNWYADYRRLRITAVKV